MGAMLRVARGGAGQVPMSMRKTHSGAAPDSLRHDIRPPNRPFPKTPGTTPLHRSSRFPLEEWSLRELCSDSSGVYSDHLDTESS